MKANEKLSIYVQLLCKDVSILHTSEYVRLNIAQEDANGFFKGISPQDLLGSNTKKTQEQAFARLVFALKTMLRFNIHLEAMIRVMQVQNTKIFMLSKETKLKDFAKND